MNNDIEETKRQAREEVDESVKRRDPYLERVTEMAKKRAFIEEVTKDVFESYNNRINHLMKVHDRLEKKVLGLHKVILLQNDFQNDSVKWHKSVIEELDRIQKEI